VFYLNKKKKREKKRPRKKVRARKEKSMIRKRLKGKKKLLTRKLTLFLTPGGQFHPIHEISVSFHGFHRITEPLPCQVYQLSVR
jgi:hypothetical protein